MMRNDEIFERNAESDSVDIQFIGSRLFFTSRLLVSLGDLARALV